ncbi:uncharacterized protein LOC144076242 [Stigmatopora argus]
MHAARGDKQIQERMVKMERKGWHGNAKESRNIILLTYHCVVMMSHRNSLTKWIGRLASSKPLGLCSCLPPEHIGRQIERRKQKQQNPSGLTGKQSSVMSTRTACYPANLDEVSTPGVSNLVLLAGQARSPVGGTSLFSAIKRVTGSAGTYQYGLNSSRQKGHAGSD